jgi:benzoyl-CoA reductase/2-hydroxyglutaryl-CoA dehydratase subunit BcrC/BadD/HgdB
MDTQVRRPNKLNSVSLIGQMMAASFADIKRRAAEGKKVAWANGLPGFLLARGAHMPVLHAEGFIAGLAARGQEKPLQDAAEAFRMLPDACSYARSFIGLARIVNGDFSLDSYANQDIYRMPKPDLYINVEAGGCGTGRWWGDSVAAIFDIPAFHLESRFNWDESDVEYNIADFIRKEQELITLMERVTGQPYDWDCLKEVLNEAKQAATLRQEIMKLCQHVPAPASFFDMAASIGLVCHLVGMPGTGDLLRKIRDEVEQRITQGIGSVPMERYRLYWNGILSWPQLGVLARKFAALDACLVAGSYTHLQFLPRPDMIDPERPLESIAYNCDTLVNYDYDHQAKTIAEFCKEYSIDGLLMSETQTCRVSNGPNFAIMDGVARRLGLPSVAIGGDSCDPRFYSDAQVDTRLQALLETIEARRKARQI